MMSEAREKLVRVPPPRARKPTRRESSVLIFIRVHGLSPLAMRETAGAQRRRQHRVIPSRCVDNDRDGLRRVSPPSELGAGCDRTGRHACGIRRDGELRDVGEGRRGRRRRRGRDGRLLAETTRGAPGETDGAINKPVGRCLGYGSSDIPK